MKQELPFAVALLAIGCLLWFNQSNPVLTDATADNSDQISAKSGSTTDSTPDSATGAQTQAHPNSSDAGESHSVTRASYQDPDQKSDPVEPQFLSVEGKGAYIHANSDAQAVKTMSLVSQQLAESDPLGASIELTGHMFDRTVSATGNYFQMGQGTHKSRIELSFGVQPKAATVFQLCDGRFVYTLQTSAARAQPGPNTPPRRYTFELVDLSKLQEEAGEKANRFTPTGWVATGGISSLLQHLASAFNFGVVEVLDENTIALRGSWDAKALQAIVANLKEEPHGDSPVRSGVIDWDRIPSQLPHGVELILEKSESEGYFPRQVSFVKFFRRSDSESEPDSVVSLRTEPTVTLKFSRPQRLSRIADRFFVIDSANLKSVNTTDRYRARIRAFQQIQTAANETTVER